MPFKSKAQRRYMYKNHPEIAKKWEGESSGLLPDRVVSNITPRSRRRTSIRRRNIKF